METAEYGLSNTASHLPDYTVPLSRSQNESPNFKHKEMFHANYTFIISAQHFICITPMAHCLLPPIESQIQKSLS